MKEAKMSKGAIKKIDTLGRIVIPRSIRKSLSIKKDDSLEIAIVGNSIQINKAVAIKDYDNIALKYAKLFSNCNINILVSNRDQILFNNTDVDEVNVKELLNMSIYELLERKNDFGTNCDIRPIIIDSNPEGIVIICASSCNEIVGELFNMIVTSELDISC
jgi:AbrB family looped-hinge helix DNA binding protein